MAPQYPLAYLLTFTTYGTRLHGDERSSIDGRNSDSDRRHVEPDRGLQQLEELRLAGGPVLLDPRQRQLCERQVAEVRAHRRWNLLAGNVRTNHVHVVVGAAATPEKVVGDLKAWCTRRLREHRLVAPDGDVWSAHGSTKYLWTPTAVQAACRYVRFEQGAGTGVGLAAADVGWSPS